MFRAPANAGALVFEPASLTVAKGESITFVNNAGFPHNVVFDEDEVPEGVNAEAISHEDYLNAPGETFAIKLDTAGSYSYYCEPHQGAGMAGAWGRGMRRQLPATTCGCASGGACMHAAWL